MPDDKIKKEFACRCGSMDRFMGRIAEKERAAGNIPEGITGAIEVMTQPVANPNPVIPYPPGTKKPCGTAYFDICMNCGRKYCFMVMESEGALITQPSRFAGHP
jgi:hypothetical protein